MSISFLHWPNKKSKWDGRMLSEIVVRERVAHEQSIWAVDAIVNINQFFENGCFAQHTHSIAFSVRFVQHILQPILLAIQKTEAQNAT